MRGQSLYNPVSASSVIYLQLAKSIPAYFSKSFTVLSLPVPNDPEYLSSSRSMIIFSASMARWENFTDLFDSSIILP